ncbi:unnamed protein product [Colias eurytheme]|nr:unnamed protein product [Colias eurytheme]
MAATEEDEVIRETFMVKRSQNKKIFTPINYKERWFVLTRKALIYYDSDGQKRKERGRISTETIHTVEQAQLGELSKQLPDGDNEKSPTYRYPFQVGYTEQNTDYTLYLAAREHSERLSWIHDIRTVCISNSRRARYHPAVWSARRWACCDAERRSAAGCALTAVWPLPEPDLQLILHDQKPNLSLCDRECRARTSGRLAAPMLQIKSENEPMVTKKKSKIPCLSLSSFLPALEAVTAAVTMPGGGSGPPGTPSAKPKEKRTKVVVALYPFKAIESGDLSLEKGAEYEVIDDSQEHWWKVKDENGLVGYIPSNYVKEKETIGLQKYEWYVGEMSRQRAESVLKQEDKEGCFVVRNSSTKGMYTLSLYTKVNHSQTKHYHIKQNARGEFYLSDKHCCASIPELINYHKHNSGGLCSRLKATPCDRPAPPTAGLSHGEYYTLQDTLSTLSV